MLTWLRDKAKIFLIATIVIFVALIFFDWGMDSGSVMPSNPYERAVAKVAGKNILPEEYSNSLQTLSNQYRQVLVNSGNPDPEAMLLLMGDVLAEEAFTGLIDSRLEEKYLEGLGWGQLTVEQAEAILEAQVGMQDLGGLSAEEYIQQIIDQQPGLYEQYLYQTYMSSQSLRFPMAAGMLSITSASEVDFLHMDSQGILSARYVVFDSTPSEPNAATMEEFFASNPEQFIRPSGSLLRYVTVKVVPGSDDVNYALNMVDSLSFASPGSPVSLTREQFIQTFGQDTVLVAGERCTPFQGIYTGNPAIGGCHVLLLDSLIPAGTDTLQDTLYLRSWEVPVLPGFDTVRSLMWEVEDQTDDLLASDVPQVSDPLNIADFGNMVVDGSTPLTGLITEELKTFAEDTIWPDSTGPLFFSPSYAGGYPAFTLVRRLQFYPADTLDLLEARESGYLQQAAYAAARLDASRIAAEAALEEITASATNLGTWAAAEDHPIHTTPSFTASQVRAAAYGDPDASTGILASVEFAVAALTAPEFQAVGPFRTGSTYVLAEIISRQNPQNNPSVNSMMYAVAQRGADQISMQHIIARLRDTEEILDLRDEWQEYATAVEDSIRAMQESIEE